MNKNLHRIVFSKLRSQWRGRGGNRIEPWRTGRSRRWSRALVAVPGWPRADRGRPHSSRQQRPTVLTAPNGVPLVNIQTPSAAGVSRNTYRQFDVQQQGAILNNSRTQVQTQLGGWVGGNPWLARGCARVILNEVNSSDPSQLRGYVEVAGRASAGRRSPTPRASAAKAAASSTPAAPRSPPGRPSSTAAASRAIWCSAAPSASVARAWTRAAATTPT